MMMRQIESYVMAALTCTLFVTAIPALGAVTENQNLKDVISQYHDAHMTVEDLAFFLATHNFNATPKGGYVQITIGSTIYKAVPNSETGLAEISIMN
jgi:K+ transporter